MTSAEAVERAFRLITPKPNVVGRTSWRTMLNVLIKDALIETANQFAASADREQREQLRKSFPSITTDANGIASLTALTDAAEPILIKYFNTAEIHIAGVPRRLTLLPDESAVKMDRTPGFPFGTLRGNELLVYNGGAPFVGDVSIRGPFIPALTTMKKEIEEPYVLVLYSMATRQIPSRTRTAAQELQAVVPEPK